MLKMASRRVHVVDLEDNLEARIQYLQSFLDFTSGSLLWFKSASDVSILTRRQADISILLGGSKYVRPLLPDVVDAFYSKLLQYDVTAQMLGSKSSGYEGRIDTAPTESSLQMQYRKLVRGFVFVLSGLWTKPKRTPWLTSCRFYGDICRSCSPTRARRNTGSTSTKLGGFMFSSSWAGSALTLALGSQKQSLTHGCRLKHASLPIAYIHLSAALGHLQNLLNEAILNHPRLKSERKMALIKAIGKVMWIQNDMFARWQIADDTGRAPATPKRVESEGYLHGLNVLARAEEQIQEPETPVDEMTCPFDSLSNAVRLPRPLHAADAP
jgi:hypothetical protein